MTDRELLELAAKAAGISGKFDETTGDIWRAACILSWNSLKYDGEALRLAVKLGIEYCYGYGLDGKVQRVIVDDDLHVMVQGGDTLAATRRAITMAAAEIGKDMK